jgi:hypothetical protein
MSTETCPYTMLTAFLQLTPKASSYVIVVVSATFVSIGHFLDF